METILQSAPRPTPARIVEPDGTVHTGWFEEPFQTANLDRAPAVPAPRGLVGRILRRGARRLRLKQWHYTSVATPGHFLAAAILDAGYLGVSFVYVVDRTTGRVDEYGTMTPLGRGITIAPNSLEGETSIDVAGYGSVRLGNTQGRRSIAIDLAGSGEAPPLRADFTIHDDGCEPPPMVAVEPLGPRHWLYTHKCYGLAAEGRLQLAGETIDVPRGDALAGIDWNRGYRRYETFWNWAAGTGRDTAGRPVGFTMTARRPRDGRRAPPAGDALDCALWLDGRRIRLGPIRFDYTEILGPWRITDTEGLVDLQFEPAGERIDDTNFGVIVSQFHQPYGRFHGTLRSRDGAVFTIDDVFGVTEEHFARW